MSPGKKILPQYAKMTREELNQAYAEMDEIFENSVIEIIKRFSPKKSQISVSHECLQSIREAVRAKIEEAPDDFIDNAASHELNMYPSIISRRISVDSIDEESQMSFDSSEGQNDEESQSSSANERSQKSSSHPEGFKASHKKMSKAQRVQELRAHRRKIAIHRQFDRIECPLEDNFKDYFFDWYSEQIIAGGDEIFVFHKIINSIKDYYERLTFPQTVTRHLKKFLRQHAIFSSEYLFEMYATTDRIKLTPEMRVLECKVQVLMELQAISMEEEELKDQENREEPNIINIVRILSYIYIGADAPVLREFLEEKVADTFNHLIPKVVARVFDKLCLALPADLEEHADPNSNSSWSEDVNPCARRLRASREETSKELQAMIEENTAESSSSSDTSNGKENKKKIKKEVEEPKDEPSTSQVPPPATPKRRDVRKEKFIPETPEEKLVIKEEIFDEVVKQTPIAKLRQSQKRSCRRLSELVKLSEERTRPTRAAALASEKANKVIMSTAGNIRQIASTTTKETLFALHSPTPRPQRSARTNLIERFNSSISTPTTEQPKESMPPSKGKRKNDPVVLVEEPERKRTRSSISSLPSSPISPIAKGIPGLGKDQLQLYKKRMSDISKCKSPQASTHLRARTSLFEESDTSPGKPKVEEAVQKNRTGREVRAGTTVHIAHILLNVHNAAPLVAFNTSKMKKEIPRLQRLVRIAKKSQKLRLQRLRNRVRHIRAEEETGTAPDCESDISSMRGDASTETTRRSSRQRIDLSQAEEGFDRDELERALRASLNEAQQREKDQPKSKGKKKIPERKEEKPPAEKPKPVEKKENKKPIEKKEEKKPVEKKEEKKVEKKPEPKKAIEKKPVEKKEAPKKEAKPEVKKEAPEPKKKASPIKRKAEPSSSSEAEDVKPEKKTKLTQPAKKGKETKEEQEDVKPEKTEKPLVKSSQKSSQPAKKAEPKKTETKKDAKPKTKAELKKTTKSKAKSSKPAVGREHALGKRLAHTQASDFITLLACATKVLGGLDQSTDYILQ